MNKLADVQMDRQTDRQTDNYFSKYLLTGKIPLAENTC